MQLISTLIEFLFDLSWYQLSTLSRNSKNNNNSSSSSNIAVI